MNINATLFVELVVFAGFVGLTRLYIWPPLIAVIEKRQADIAQGVEDAKQGNKLLEQANDKTREMIDAAKQKHKSIIAQADETAKQILSDAKDAAQAMQKSQVDAAQAEIDKQAQLAKEGLEEQTLAYMREVLEKVMRKTPDQSQLDQLINEAMEEVNEAD